MAASQEAAICFFILYLDDKPILSIMDIKELIPKHKDDKNVINELEKLSLEELKPIIPDLLEWLQDINWPIAIPIANLLKPFSEKIVTEIIEILKTNDGIWKLWILISFARANRNLMLLEEIKRIATLPTKDEIEAGANVEAIAILKGVYR